MPPIRRRARRPTFTSRSPNSNTLHRCQKRRASSLRKSGSSLGKSSNVSHEIARSLRMSAQGWPNRPRKRPPGCGTAQIIRSDTTWLSSLIARRASRGSRVARSARSRAHDVDHRIASASCDASSAPAHSRPPARSFASPAEVRESFERRWMRRSIARGASKTSPRPAGRGTATRFRSKRIRPHRIESAPVPDLCP